MQTWIRLGLYNYDDGWTLGECLTYLKHTLDNNPAEYFSQYTGDSPDRFLVAATFSPTTSNPVRDAEPPNATRSAIWELRFMSTDNALGDIRFDTVHLAQSTGFTIIRNHGLVALNIPVNFLPAVITVQPLKGDMNLDSKLRPADVVLHLNCVMLGAIPPVGQSYCDLNCDGQATAADVVLELNAVFREEEFPC